MANHERSEHDRPVAHTRYEVYRTRLQVVQVLLTGLVAARVFGLL